MPKKTPFAFVLVKWKGSNAEPITKAHAEHMFTAAGRGTNVVDWFDENTHGNIDMTGNQVFGWIDLAISKDDWAAAGSDRGQLHVATRAAAAAAGLDLSGFTAVVAVTNIGVGVWGGTGDVACSADNGTQPFWAQNIAPSVLCQEMIHGLGVYEHTCRDGSDTPYQDPYDVMSMFIAYAAHDPADPSIPIGPGMNAAFMQRCGWLDTSRAATTTGPVTLRPLHRRDLPGPLYALVGGFYVEYRPSQRWDAGFPSLVLVHYIAKNTSYLIAELRTGDSFSWGDPKFPYRASGSIGVDGIDDQAETATLSIAYQPSRRLPEASARPIFPGDLEDGAGLWLHGNRFVRIPPRSPSLMLVEAAAALLSIDETPVAPALQTEARADVYTQLLDAVGELLEHSSGLSAVADHISDREARRFHQERAER